MALTETGAVESVEALRAAVAQVMAIEDTTLGEPDKFYVRFRGRLIMDSAEAYALTAERFRALGYTALFRKEQGVEMVLAVKGVMSPLPSRLWLNYLLLALTLVSVLLAGGMHGYGNCVSLIEAGHKCNLFFTGGVFISTENLTTTFTGWLLIMLGGWPFLLSLLGILLAHELGHYFTARYHKVVVTLPYFIPFPLSPLGTMGAFIQMKSVPPNRRILMDIAIAGPLAGFVIAVPVLLVGLLTSPVLPIPEVLKAGQSISFEGNSILYVFAKWMVFGKLLPAPVGFDGLPPLLYMLRYYLTGVPTPWGGADVIVNQVAWAGWAGLLVTGLNLIPAGQLDGGHMLYVLLGSKRAQRIRLGIVAVLLLLGIFWPGWLLWAGLIYFFGRMYAEPLDQITELDGRRRALAVMALVLFVLVITPVPLSIF